MSEVDDILKKYGNIIKSGKEISDKKVCYIPISPSIDMSIGGGLPEGSWVGLAGPASCGKTTTALQIAANAQNILNVNGEKRKIYYINAESRLKPMNLKGIHNLIPEEVIVISSTKDKILSGEENLEICKSLLKSPESEGAVLILDSVSIICPSEELTSEIKAAFRPSTPKLLSLFCKQMAPVVNSMGSIVIFIHHLHENTGTHGEKWIVDGGNKIKYQTDLRMITKTKPEAWEENGKLVGQKVTWSVEKSTNSGPCKDVVSYLRYGHGLDALKEEMTLALDLGVIDQKGAWFYFNDEKYHGGDKVYKAIEENSELRKILSEKLKELIC